MNYRSSIILSLATGVMLLAACQLTAPATGVSKAKSIATSGISPYAWSIPLGGSNHKAGVPLGGIGAGNFMFNAHGSFGPWRMRPQDLEGRVLPQAAFHLREECGGAPARTVTLATSDVMEAWPKLAPGTATYHALFPRGWCEYGGLQTTASVEFFSPIIKENYRETSLPVGVFVFRLGNPTAKPAKVSVMLTFPNAQYGGRIVRQGLSNASVHGNGLSAVVMKADDPKNPAETQGSQWCIATGAGASMRTAWDGAGDGREILADFADDGQLQDGLVATAQPAGALAVSRMLQPGETVEIPFVLAWDFPQVSFGSGTRWWRRHTEYFPAGQPQAAAMAADALAKHEAWRQAIIDWQAPYLAGAAPAWLKQGAMNELYYTTFGGSFWENGCVTKPKQYGNRPGQHLQFVMECIEYPYAETFDVRQHACRVTRDLWPQIERDILLGFADFVKDAKVNPKGAPPHDAGSPHNDPWFAFDQYAHDASSRYHGVWPTPWSEYPPKLIEYSYGYWKATGDTAFLKDAYPALLRAYRWMETTDTDKDGLSEMLSSEYAHNKLFNAVLWLGALDCMKEITQELKDPAMAAKVDADFNQAQASTEREFWDAGLGYYKFNETNNSLMADALVGLRIPDTFGRPPVLDQARLTSHCRQLFRRLVLPLRDLNGDGVGDMGMANCLTPDSKPAVGSAEPGMPHHNEVWVGVSYLAAANLIHYGQAANDGALISQGLHTAFSTYERTWRDAAGNRWFNTPEAWAIDNPDARRTDGPYQRARGIWEVLMEANKLDRPAPQTVLPMSIDIPAPAWTKDLVICEIATKAFTSPNGPESGTFKALQARIPHLQATGINGIWLTGHSLSDAKHFYNIWTQYACVDPFKLDPSLGTPEEFKAMIDACHTAGIRVFVDVITHGVMKNSPLITQHPDWFKGGSWGMTDYDWAARNAGLDQWWVEGWTETVTRYGVDGFRLDVNGYRYDLWKEIRRRCAAANHPIVIFPEPTQAVAGGTDFAQAYLRVCQTNNGPMAYTKIATDLPETIQSTYGPPTPKFSAKLTFADGTIVEAVQGKTLSVLGDRGDKTGRLQAEADGIADYHLQVTGMPTGQLPASIVLDGGPGLQWRWPANGVNWVVKAQPAPATGTLELVLSTLENNRAAGFFGSIQLSCHDNGWEGFPLDQNPYAARGSRSLIGYTTLFAPAIPIFMAGEEFDAGYRPLPTLSPDLFGGKNPGNGRWLYGSMIDWSQLGQPQQQAMLKDVSRMIAIRKAHADILAAEAIATAPRLATVPVEGEGAATLPKPYVRWHGNRAILIVANPGDKRVQLKLKLAMANLGWKGKKLTVTDLWGNQKPASLVIIDGIAEIPVEIGADKTPGGGLSVLLLENRP